MITTCSRPVVSCIAFSQVLRGVLKCSNIVLTAGHCFFSNNVLKNYPFYVGGNSTTRSGTSVKGEKGFVHPLYDPLKVQAYDFAVVLLKQGFPDIPLMTLNTDRNHPRDKNPLTVFGFGLLKEGDAISKLPTVMQEVTVPMVQNCSKYYASGKINDSIVFCAGDMPGGGKDACQGDSGGPIVDASGTQVGLVRCVHDRFFWDSLLPSPSNFVDIVFQLVAGGSVSVPN